MPYFSSRIHSVSFKGAYVDEKNTDCKLQAFILESWRELEQLKSSPDPGNGELWWNGENGNEEYGVAFQRKGTGLNWYILS